MDKHLHIVTHDVPWPADFGGVADLFYKIKALHSLGIKISLHCFTKDRPQQEILNKYCVSVNYYPRKSGLPGLSMQLPYIVSSRTDPALLQTLAKDNHPVLLEGIHCTYLLKTGQLQNRKVFVRLFNVEYKYYYQLAKYESNLLRKFYFLAESYLLKKYERHLAAKANFWALSQQDEAWYKKEFQAPHIRFMPFFLPWEKMNSLTGTGNFCLYHGNLSVSENEKAASWLLKEVFSKLDVPFIIAGKNPSRRLEQLAASQSNSRIISNPSDAEMQSLIREAQINVLPSFNATGTKLKLLNALYHGRHCLVNEAASQGSGMKSYCEIASTASEFTTGIRRLFSEPFSTEKLAARSAALNDIYQWEKNARRLIAWIY